MVQKDSSTELRDFYLERIPRLFATALQKLGTAKTKYLELLAETADTGTYVIRGSCRHLALPNGSIIGVRVTINSRPAPNDYVSARLLSPTNLEGLLKDADAEVLNKLFQRLSDFIEGGYNNKNDDGLVYSGRG